MQDPRAASPRLCCVLCHPPGQTALHSNHHSQPLASFHSKNKNLHGMCPLCSPKRFGDGRRGWSLAWQTLPWIFFSRVCKAMMSDHENTPFKRRRGNQPLFQAELSAAHAAAQRDDSPDLPVKATVNINHSQTSPCN